MNKNNIMATLLRKSYDYGKKYNEFAARRVDLDAEDLAEAYRRQVSRVYGMVVLACDLLGKTSATDWAEIKHQAFTIFKAAADGKIK